MNPIRRWPCADPGQKQSPGEWMTQKGIDSSMPVTEAACALVESPRVSHHGHAGITRHSPRNGFNGLLRALLGDRACLPPSPAKSLSADLTPASGCQDHTASPSARNVIRLLTCRVHRIPHPTSVTIAIRPSCGTGCADIAADLGL